MSGEPGRHDGIDGLRAVAVALVVAYHVGVPWVPGGFVGVDVFFALSGYLVTALLVREHDRDGGVALGAFWARRARRLYPLSWLVLAVVAVAGAAGVWDADQRRALPAATAAAFGQVANWWQGLSGGYLQASSAPSPLRHYWSLSVEEQFYLAWPLAVVATAAVARRRGWRPWRALGTVTVVGAAASVATGFFVDAQWAYLSTAVRAVALLAGALLAVAWARWPLRGPRTLRGRTWVWVAALPAAAVLAAVATTAHPEDRFLGRGGFALVAVCSAAAVAAAVCGPFRRALALAPLAWLGRRSYGVYLVHWPLVVALGPGRPWPVVAAVVVPVSLAAAEVLYRLVERPVVRGRVPRPALAAGAAVVAAATVVGLAAGWPRTTPSQQVGRTLVTVADPTTTTLPVGATTTVLPPCRPSAPPTTFGPDSAFDMSVVHEVADPDGPCSGAVKVMVVGDSMARGVANGLAALADPRVQVWDRSVLGCSLNALNYGRPCPRWRDLWRMDVEGVDPDVVVLYTTVHDGLQDVPGAPYLSDTARARRTAELADAVRLLGSRGATVVLSTVPVPRRPNGLFYCQGRATASRCDPAWVAAWNQAQADAARAAGAQVVDFAGWVAARPATAAGDRPDGMHLSGRALVDHSRWLVPLLVVSAPR